MIVNSVLRVSPTQGQKVWSCSVSPDLAVQGLSLQADRFRRRMLEQRTSRFLFEGMVKASVGTDVIPVLSQMILDMVVEDRARL